MMVTFVSQCEKNALKKTRRVLDAFANRIGDNTWQTLITQDGLNTVKKLLRQSASRSTAVSCHWIRSRSRSQFLWVVGNKNKFNAEGVVAVNWTEKDLFAEKPFSSSAEIFSNLAAVAGFFHDLGKANKLFQIKLGALNDDGVTEKHYEPLRHEWISMRIFQAFVANKTDQEWLSSLADINNSTVQKLEKNLDKYQDLLTNNIANPFISLPPIAKMVAWLIVSHHRLAQFSQKAKDSNQLEPEIEKIGEFENIFESSWISPQALDDWPTQSIEANWNFPFGLPFQSAYWQTNISIIAKRALAATKLHEDFWHQNKYVKHLARLALMLADHAESSRKNVDNQSADRNYLAFANTDKNAHGVRYLKQKLDEHNINVGKLAYRIANQLPNIKSEFQSLESVKALEKAVPKNFQAEFGWQDKATKLAASLKDTVKDKGFFGISMASTGKGKTRANARIMYALSEKGQCRFNVALGLRTLTIQTAEALRENLFADDAKGKKLAEKYIALLVGSQAVRDLQQIDLTKEHKNTTVISGSESSETLVENGLELLSCAELTDFSQFSWLEHDPKILKLLNAPILVSTIDYLIPATEGVRGGRQIAPMLRLLTSDLVLDEPDDFSSADFPALCRLVNWAGMLGSKVLISTATIMPCEAQALFEAFLEGRKAYDKVNSMHSTTDICCAWFDECNKPQHFNIGDIKEFQTKHNDFVLKRIKELAKKDLRLRQGKIVNTEINNFSSPSHAMASRINQSITELHNEHYELVDGRTISIGLVRIANIDPLAQIAKHLFKIEPPENTRIHYCVYHGQFPLLQRSSIEQMLDNALKRHHHDKWLINSNIKSIIENTEGINHIFVVLATSVAEVGRDHDYDWAIIEPSSSRSIIQLAGRVQRHRKKAPNKANIHVLNKNYRGLKTSFNKEERVFIKPGFETKVIGYFSWDLNDLKIEQELFSISAAPRIYYKPQKKDGKPDLTGGKFNCFFEAEHFSQKIALYGMKPRVPKYAALWWQHDISWSSELQRRQPFRQSQKTQDYCLSQARRGGSVWMEKISNTYPVSYQSTDDIKHSYEALSSSNKIAMWHQFSFDDHVVSLTESLNKTEQEIYQLFTQVALRVDEKNLEQWIYHPSLGIYKELKKDTFS